MPFLDFPIQETATRIIDPVAEQITEALLRDLGLRDLFPGSLYVRQEDRTGASLTSDANGAINLSRDRCDVVYDPVLNPAEVAFDALNFDATTAYGSTKLYKNARVPLFVDPLADVQVVERQVPCSLTMEVALRFKTYDVAQLAFDALVAKYDRSAVRNLHDVVYTYPLSMPLAMALMAVYRCRSVRATRSFVEYLQDCTAGALRVEVARDELADGAAAAKALVVKQRALSVTGAIEFTQTKPEAELSAEGLPDRYAVRFTYKVQFFRPALLQMTFPVIVENQELPYALFETTEHLRAPALDGVLQSRSLTHYLRGTRSLPLPLVRFPFYDDFQVPKCRVTEYAFHTFWLSAFTLDDGGTSIDLTDLDDVALHPVVRAILALHTPADLFGDTALYNVTVFSNDQVVDASRLSWDPLTWTVGVSASDRTKRYHVALSEATDLGHLDPKWLAVLLRYRCFYPLTILKNLNRLIALGYYTVAPSDALLGTIERCMQAGNLDSFIAQLIAAGHCGSELYQYASTAFQFADYISNTRSTLTGCYLYNELLDLALAAGCVDPSRIPGRYVKTSSGYPVGANFGGYNGPNTPLRIFRSAIIAAR